MAARVHHTPACADRLETLEDGHKRVPARGSSRFRLRRDAEIVHHVEHAPHVIGHVVAGELAIRERIDVPRACRKNSLIGAAS
jgi:hypothetical protein